jgi:hypothetical protein
MTDGEPKGFDMAEAFDAILTEQEADELLLTDEVEPIAEPEGPARDEHGKFVSREPKELEPEEPIEPVAEAPAEVVEPIEVPSRMPKEIRDAWNELPEGVRTALERREEETHRIATKVDRERQIGRHFDTMVEPYKELIEQEGGTPLAAVADLLNTAKILRSGTPEQKVALLNQVATQFGIDIEQAYYARPDPQLASAQLQIARRDAELATYHAQSASADGDRIEAQINDFKATHEHFDTVSGEMARLIAAGVVPDLQTAYDYAIGTNEALRSTSIEQAVEKRIADERAKQESAVSKARRAAVSPSSASGASAKPPGSASLSDIEAMSLSYDEVMARQTG